MSRFPYIEIGVRIGAEWFTGEALVDTGYDGELIIPLTLVPESSGAVSESNLVMPDGHVHEVDGWSAELLIEDHSFLVDATAFGDELIVGRDVISQMEVCFEFGRSIRIRFEDE
jgi:hypothetical protein